VFQQFSMLRISRTSFWPYGVAVALVLVTLLLMLMLDPWLRMARSPFLLFFSAVMVSAWYGGLRPGLLATGLSTLLSTYFFLEPRHSLLLDFSDAVRVTLFLIQGILFSFLCEALHGSKQRTETSLRRLQASEERFRLALNNSNISVFQQDRSLRYQWIHTPEGLDADAIAGKTDRDLFPVAEAEQLIEIKRHVLEKGVAARAEVCLTVDGDRKHYDLIVQPLQSGYRRTWGVISIAVNITELKQIEQELQAANQRASDILETITDAFFAVDRQWRFTYVNRQFEAYSQFSREELLGKNIWTLFPETVGSVFYDEYHRAIAEQVVVNVEALAPNSTGRWLGARAYPRPEGLSVYFQDITERKQAEKKIQSLNRELETRINELQALLDVVPVGIAIAEDPDCKVIRANPFFQEIFDIPPEANLSTTGAGNDVLPYKRLRNGIELLPDELPLQVAAKGIEVRNTELQLIRPDGASFDLLGSAVPLFDSKNRVRGCVAVFMDVTEYKRIQAELKISEEHLRLAIEGADLGMWDYDLVNLKLLWSERCKEMFGLASDAEITYNTFIKTIHPDDQEGVNRALERAIARQGDFNLETRTVWPDGAVHWVAVMGRVYYNDSNQPLRMAGVVFDITDRKQAEDERDNLLYQEQLARQLAEVNIQRVSQLQALTASLARALTTTEINEILLHQGLEALNAKRGWIAQYLPHERAVETIASQGYGDEEILEYRRIPLTASVPVIDSVLTRQPVLLESPEEYRQCYPAIASKYIASGTQALAAIPLLVENRVIGSLGLSFDAPRPFSDADRSFMLTLGQQCAQALERARLYEAERIARETAESANRVKDEFLAVLSHELRSPLNPILGWSKLLRWRQFDEDSRNRALETIERNARLQAQLIEDLLDVSRILRGKISLNVAPVNLVVPIQGAIETVRLAAEAKSIDIRPILSADVGQVAGDSARLQQIVWNLLSNAVKFTPTGGWVEVRLSSSKGDEVDKGGIGEYASLSPSAFPTPNTQHRTLNTPSAILTVTDSGKGIQPDFLPYVFEHFRQADSTTTRKFGGLGLGLAIARHLVELHGGTIRADSRGEGQGATFTVTLPLLRVESGQLQYTGDAEGSSYSSAWLEGVRILVVDDEPDMRDYVAVVLQQAGADVTLVASASEALALLLKTNPDLLISDIGMPDVDGYMLLRQVRQLPPEQGGRVPAIALTAYAAEYDQQHAIAVGFDMHLPKPIEPDQLSKAIAKLLNRA
jgi:PAS domain S-box-containing protein